MKRVPVVLSCFFLLLVFQKTKAQKVFVEGELFYAITISKSDPEQRTQNSIKGTLRVKQKGHAVLKELELKNGFKSTKLFMGLGKPSYSFVNIGDQNFALKNDFENVNRALSKCSQLSIENLPIEINAIAGFKTERGRMLCNDRKPIVIYYTKEWQINNPLLFEEFPSFQSLPLSFDVKNDDGSQIHFELINIESKPLDNSTFQIPNGYKTISQEEYKSWQH